MNHKEVIESVRKQFQTDSDPFPKTNDEIEALRNKYLGRKGIIADLFAKMNDIEAGSRPEFGKELNLLKNDISNSFSKYVTTSKNNPIQEIDHSLPGWIYNTGHLHPLQITLNEIKTIFTNLGFSVAYGPEIDDDFHNFSALNFPPEHPARDMQDTFFIENDIVMRTHTSNVQVHLMEEQEPPLRYIVPGRVFRNESISFKSYCLFHQIEGLYVDKNVSFAEHKGVLEYFVRQMFGVNTKMRFRPSFFPFTEPSAEVDIWSEKRGQWLEIMGSGMVDPEVFKSVKIDSEVWNGYAFGMGVERICMLKYDIDDIRLLYQGDLRFLEQF